MPSSTDMQLYFRHLFPSKQLYDWLSYGHHEYFQNREFSFTLPGDIYLRFRSYDEFQDFVTDLVKKTPDKIDIGGIYNAPPKAREVHPNFKPLEKELVFDVDISDYDDVRVCCQDKGICDSCWPLMAVATRTMEHLLTKDFGFQHLLFVFSGRRGVHCWCCDKAARVLSDDERCAVVGYLNVHEGGEHQRLNIEHQLRRNCLHPSLEQVYNEVIRPGFEAMFLNDDNVQNNILSDKTAEKIGNVIASMVKNWKESDVCRDKLNKVLSHRQASARQRWSELLRLLSTDKNFRCEWVLKYIEFLFMYPRLDINVSKHRGHLLKAPFVIHPGTGNVCVPLNIDKVESFHVASCPKLEQVIGAYEKDTKILAPLISQFEEFVAGCVEDDKNFSGEDFNDPE